MKLEVGMYVRTETGLISKIVELPSWGIYIEDSVDCFSEKDIKASHNIIDLIEVGDYVNGKLVEDIFEKTNYADKSIKLKGSGDYWYNEHIKSIVTKEQF